VHPRTPRSRHLGLLTRPPCEQRGVEQSWTAIAIDPIAQLRVLGDLLTAGLLSQDEFDRQKAKVLDS
jgi:hypothetical protein